MPNPAATVAIALLTASAAADDIRMSTAYLPIPPNPISLIPLDTDGDAREEILAFYQSPPRYTLFRADAQGRLEQQETVNFTPFDLYRVRAADINADGRTDFVTYSSDATVYQVMLNQGNGAFIPAPDSPLPSIFTNEFNLADVDSDGLPEIIGLAPRHIAVYRNLGQGRFAAPALSPSLDNGRKDIAAARVSPTGPPAIGVLGTGLIDIYHATDDTGLHYERVQTVILPGEGVALQSADIGSTGRESFLIAAAENAAIVTVQYDPDLNSYSAVTTPGAAVNQENKALALSRSPDRPRRAAFGFSGVGTPRLLTNNTTDAGSFEQPGPLPGLFSSLQRITFADLLGDGNEHLVFSNGQSLLSLEPGPDADFRTAAHYEPLIINTAGLIPFPSRPFTYLATTGGFLPMQTLTIEQTSQGPRVLTAPIPNVIGGGGTVGGWAVLDINGDSRDDLAHITNYTANGRIVWQIQQPDGSYSNPQEIFISNGTITNLVAADLNQDGYDDLVLIHPTGGVRIFYGQSSGQLSSPDTFNLSNSPNAGSLLVADLDNDGLLDLICANRLGLASSAALRVAYGMTTMSYRPPVSFAAPPNSGSLNGGQIDAADLNDDGILDIVILSPEGSHLILSNGPRSYHPPVLVAGGTNSIDVRLIDFDNDARPEILTVFRASSTIAYRDDDGQFTRSHQFLHTPETRAVAAVDLNNDALPDLLYTSIHGASIVYNRSRSPCIADYIPDGVLDFFDIVRYMADFNNQVPATDLNNDGKFNFFDVAAFILAFTNGCP